MSPKSPQVKDFGIVVRMVNWCAAGSLGVTVGRNPRLPTAENDEQPEQNWYYGDSRLLHVNLHPASRQLPTDIVEVCRRMMPCQAKVAAIDRQESQTYP